MAKRRQMVCQQICRHLVWTRVHIESRQICEQIKCHFQLTAVRDSSENGSESVKGSCWVIEMHLTRDNEEMFAKLKGELQENVKNVEQVRRRHFILSTNATIFVDLSTNQWKIADKYPSMKTKQSIDGGKSTKTEWTCMTNNIERQI